MNHSGIFFAAVLALFPLPSGARADKTFADDIEAAFYAGDMAAVAETSQTRLAKAPGDGQALFALGAGQFLDAVAHLGQGLHRHGLRSEYDLGEVSLGLLNLPFLRLPVPPNSSPEPVTYEALRGILDRFVADMTVAEATLSGVSDTDFDLSLDLAQIRLDFNGDGNADENEFLLGAFYAVTGPVGADSGFRVDFDQSDAPWLQGYSHLLMAMAEFPLAHDWENTFNLTFHSLFPQTDFLSSELETEVGKVIANIRTLLDENGAPPRRFNWNRSWEAYEKWRTTPEGQKYLAYQRARSMLEYGAIGDLIAFVHLFNWPVVDPDRMGRVRTHLLSMIELSRENWRRVQSETDDKREWVPKPAVQAGIFDRMRVTEARVAGWNLFLDELEAILNGEKLVPHWRFMNRGVNVRRMFEEPRTFDPVLIGQGSAILPYLEEGELTSADTFWQIDALLDGGLLRYFIWFN